MLASCPAYKAELACTCMVCSVTLKPYTLYGDLSTFPGSQPIILTAPYHSQLVCTCGSAGIRARYGKDGQGGREGKGGGEDVDQ